MDYCGVIPKDLAIGALWPQIATLLAQALPFGRGEYELEDIRRGIEQEELFALGITEQGRLVFCVSCSIIQFPRKRVLYVQYGAGAGGARASDVLLNSARTLACDWVETRCRASVARLYRRVGFDIGYCVPILEVSP